MPLFNSKGDYCAGVGGDGVVLSVNGKAIYGPPGSAAGWITDDEILSNTWTNINDIRSIAVDRSGHERILRMGETVNRACGGGRWALLPRYATKWVVSDGSSTELPVVTFGSEDGCLVTWIDHWHGLVIAGRIVSESVVYVCQVLNAETAIWLEGYVPKTIGMPVPRLLPGEVWGLRVRKVNGKWWALYQSGYNGQLVLHPFDSFEGYTFTLPGGAAYRPDFWSDGVNWKVVWATVESEMPGQIGFTESLPPLRKLDQRPDPVPDPDPDPLPNPPEVEVVPDYSPTVQTVYRVTQPDLSTKEGCGKFTEDVAVAIHNADPEFGHLKKRPGQNQYNGHAVDAILYKKTGQAIDIIASSESADARPGWMVDVPRYSEADWIEPSSTVPAPVPDPLPPPPDLGPILESIDALEASLAALEDDLVNVTHVVQSQQLAIDSLARLLKRRMRVKGSTSRAWGHGHSVELEVENVE